MSFLDNITVDETQEVEEQVVRQESSWIDQTGAYVAEVKGFYFGESAKGANFFEVQLETADGAKIKEREYFSSQAGSTTYDVKDRSTGAPTGEKKDLPGMARLKSVSRALTGNPLGWMSAEKKIIPIYDFNKKADIDTEVNVFVAAIGLPVELLVQRTLYDRDIKDPKTGNYVPSNQVVARSEIVGWLNPLSHKTWSEDNANLDAKSYETFMDNLKKNPIKDKRKLSKNTSPEAPKSTEPTSEAVNAFK